MATSGTLRVILGPLTAKETSTMITNVSGMDDGDDLKCHSSRTARVVSSSAVRSSAVIF